MTQLRRNSAASLAGRVASAALWIVATPFVLTRLGPERFGVWSLFFAFNGYLMAFDLGVGNTMIRFLAVQRPTNDRRALLRTLRRGLWAAIALGLLWSIVVQLTRGLFAAAFHVPPAMMHEALDALTVFGICIFLLFPVQAMLASLQGLERMDLSNLCMVLGVVTQIVALYVGLSAGGGLRGAALAGLIGQAVAGALAAVLLGIELAKVPEGGTAPGPSWRDMLHFSAALQLLWSLIIFQIQSGRIVLGLIGNLTMVAEYELAFRVAGTIGGLPIIIRDPVIPAVSRVMESEGESSVKALFIATARWVYIYGVLTLGLLWLLASDIVRIWLGPGREPIAGLIRLWVFAFAANLAYAPGVAIARGIGKPAYEILSYAASLAVNIGLGILWVPLQGTRGAVNAVAVSYVVGLLVFAVAFHRHSSIAPLWSWIGRELLPRAAAGTAVVLLCAVLLSAGPAAAIPAGWPHAGVALALFVALFGLLFYPLGDTQRLCEAVWQMSGVLRRGVRTS